MMHRLRSTWTNVTRWPMCLLIKAQAYVTPGMYNYPLPQRQTALIKA